MTNSFILCADDFGLTRGISEGILDLIGMRRLSAASVMTTHQWWSRLGPALLENQNQVAIGLHLNLTQGSSSKPFKSLAPDDFFPSLSSLMTRSFTGQLRREDVRQEIESQFDAFENIAKRPPDFIDGHQHVHVLPGIRHVLLATIKHRYPQAKIWIRNPSDCINAIVKRETCVPKALFVKALSSGFKRAVQKAGFATNQGFSGFNSFDQDRRFEEDFQKSTLKLGRKHVIMCHPGYVDEELQKMDEVTHCRSQELMYLSSTRFQDLLDVMNFKMIKNF